MSWDFIGQVAALSLIGLVVLFVGTGIVVAAIKSVRKR